jgi:rifampin ADP-ribosylating transferase
MSWRTLHPVRVVDEVQDWPLYHGTRADLKPGDLIEPGYTANFGQPGRVANHVYMTRTLDAAKWGAELAAGDGPVRIYLVEPVGPIEDDPNLTDKKFRGNPTKSFRTRDAVRVTGEVREWQGHSPDAIRAMRKGLEELKDRGEDIIDD